MKELKKIMITHYDYRLMPEFAGEDLTDSSECWQIWQVDDNSVGGSPMIFESPLPGSENEKLTRAKAAARIEQLNGQPDAAEAV